MIIVAGKIYVRPGERDHFLERSRAAVVQARSFPGCLDFVVASDLIEPDRVNVYERWESAEALHAFRGDGPGDDLSAMIISAEIDEHRVLAASVKTSR
jgi:quinol monooxygenase YgiN